MGEVTKAGWREEKVGSRTSRALLEIREMILSGVLPRGRRVSELALVERTGISRTPIRAALQRLEGEGLVRALPGGGYAVASFSEQDAYDAIEVRGALEGLAARFVAERGLPRHRLGSLLACLDALEELVAGGVDAEAGLTRYTELNARFHGLLVELADSRTLARQIGWATALPFASPSAFVMVQSLLPDWHRLMTVAQDQHRCVVEAIVQREGARAQSVMVEHARLAARHLRLALHSDRAIAAVPGRSLIRLAANGKSLAGGPGGGLRDAS